VEKSEVTNVDGQLMLVKYSKTLVTFSTFLILKTYKTI